VRLRTVWFVHPRFAVRPSRGISPDRGQHLPGTRSQVKQKSALRTQLGAFSSGRLEPSWLPQRDTGRLAVCPSGRYGAGTRPASNGRSAEHCSAGGPATHNIALSPSRRARSAEHCSAGWPATLRAERCSALPRGLRRHASDCCLRRRSAGWQPAVSRIGNPRGARRSGGVRVDGRSADWKSANQQARSLRDGAGTRPASDGRSAEDCLTAGARSDALPTERGALLRQLG
jgi:hypothetical protein